MLRPDERTQGGVACPLLDEPPCTYPDRWLGHDRQLLQLATYANYPETLATLELLHLLQLLQGV
jgi:hypothetical protein